MKEYIVTGTEEFTEASRRLLYKVAEGISIPSAALPGGRSIAPVLEAMRLLPDDVLGRYEFYLVDERWERDHNQQMLRREIFDGLVQAGRVLEHQLRFPELGLPVEDAVRLYQKQLPIFDIVFLGVGEDGHVASIFPGHPVLYANAPAVSVVDSPKPPPTRLTLTFQAFTSASVFVLIFWGKQKRTAYRRFIESDDWERTPACYFKKFPHTVIFRDGRIEV